MSLTLTAKAIEKLETELDSKRTRPNEVFRLTTGPSGDFGMRLDEPTADDVVLRHEGTPLLAVAQGLSPTVLPTQHWTSDKRLTSLSGFWFGEELVRDAGATAVALNAQDKETRRALPPQQPSLACPVHPGGLVPEPGVEPGRSFLREILSRRGKGGESRTFESCLDSLPFPVYEDYEECSTVRGLWTPRWTPVFRAGRRSCRRGVEARLGGSQFPR